MRRLWLALATLAYPSATHVLTFDRMKAATASEKAIRADPAALVADAAMRSAPSAPLPHRAAPERAPRRRGFYWTGSIKCS